MYMTVYLVGKKNPKALRVDLMFTVESPKSVSCDGQTLVLALMRADVDEELSRSDIVSLKFASDEAAG